MMINFLDETKKMLKAYGKSPKDVISIGTYTHRVDWETFEKNANFEYDCGFGCQEIFGYDYYNVTYNSISPKDIYENFVIYGKGFIAYRDEYDGAEEWRVILIPDDPSPNVNSSKITFRNDYYPSFSEQFLQEEKGND